MAGYDPNLQTGLFYKWFEKLKNVNVVTAKNVSRNWLWHQLACTQHECFTVADELIALYYCLVTSFLYVKDTLLHKTLQQNITLASFPKNVKEKFGP